ncbi:MAG: hypothetical protein GEU79_03395 [Acidimicrobiia bacterium]|nr:hypothetical protein [Acidimicrobiia bacterium]
MPYILSPPVPVGRSGVWGEGDAYLRSKIYEIKPGALPPVHYDEHLLRPHSITHAEAPGHVLKDGVNLDHYFARPQYFFGWTLVIRLPAGGYVEDEVAHRINRVRADDLAPHLEGHNDISKVLITAEDSPLDEDGFHASHHVLVLEESAAHLLIERPSFDLFGTSYRSCDYQPEGIDRPIHKILFERAVVLEYLALADVPADRYFLSAFPVRLDGSTESPLAPVLYTREELEG